MIKILMSLKYILYTCFCFFISFSAWAEEEEDTRTCMSLQEYTAEGSVCLLCDIYKIIKNVCVSVVAVSESFNASLAGVVCIGVSIYIAVYILKNTASFSQQNPFALLSNNKTGLIPLCSKAAVIAFLLSSFYSDVYSYLVSPVILSCMNVGNTLMTGGIGTSFSGASNVGSLFDAVITKVEEYNRNLYIIVAMGRLLLCMAFLPDGILDWQWPLIPFGLMFYALGWMIIIGASFYLLDVLFRLAVGCMILPFAVACTISKYTSPYSKKTWNLFVNVGFNFIMMGLIIEFIVQLIGVVLTGSGNLQTLLDGKRDAAHAKKIAEDINVYTFLLTTIFCLVCFKLFMEIEKITEKVSSTSSVGKLGQKMGAEGAKMVKYPLSKITKAGKGFINTARLETGRKISESSAGMKVRGWGRGIKRGVKKTFGL